MWPSGQRCQLASVGTQVRFQPKSKLFFGGIKSFEQQIDGRFELNLNFKLNWIFSPRRPWQLVQLWINWSYLSLKIKCGVCRVFYLLSASTLTICGSTSALNALSCSICSLTVSMSDPNGRMLANLVSASFKNSIKLCRLSIIKKIIKIVSK